MKKHLGKIFLCATLALVTLFTLVGCSNSNTNNTNNNVDIAYGKEFSGANNDNTTVKSYTTAAEVKEDLALVILGEADQDKAAAIEKVSQANWDGVMGQINAMFEGKEDKIRLNESHKYVITCDKATVEEQWKAYVKLYADDNTTWTDMSDIYQNSVGVYRTSNNERDVMVDATVNTTEGKIYITVLAFDSGAMQAAMGE